MSPGPPVPPIPPARHLCIQYSSRTQQLATASTYHRRSFLWTVVLSARVTTPSQASPPPTNLSPWKVSSETSAQMPPPPERLPRCLSTQQALDWVVNLHISLSHRPVSSTRLLLVRPAQGWTWPEPEGMSNEPLGPDRLSVRPRMGSEQQGLLLLCPERRVESILQASGALCVFSCALSSLSFHDSFPTDPRQ